LIKLPMNFQCRKWKGFAGVALLFFCQSMPALATDIAWDEYVLEDSPAPVEASIKGNKRVYQRVSPDQPLEVEFMGPRKVLVHIRNAFLETEKNSKEYRVNVLMDEHNYDEFVFRTRPSRFAAFQNQSQNMLMGRLRRFMVEVPEGRHSLKFFQAASGSQEPLYLRFFTSENLSKSSKRVSMSPDEYDEVITLIYQEKEHSYYRMNSEKPVKLSVVGPTELKVITRLEFNRRMKGKHSYQIQIYEDDQLIQTRQYRTYKSDVASYHEVSSLSPGRSRSFLISVPKGKHVYALKPVGLQSESVIVKILIPQKDIGILEE
jgi:hypothetical protein